MRFCYHEIVSFFFSYGLNVTLYRLGAELDLHANEKARFQQIFTNICHLHPCIATISFDIPPPDSSTNLLGNTGELVRRPVVDDAIVQNPFNVGRKCFSGTVYFVNDVLFDGPQIHGVNYQIVVIRSLARKEAGIAIDK